MALSRTARFYRDNPDSRKRHVEYQANVNKRPEEVKKRVALGKYNRQQTKLGNNKKGDGKDASHRYDKVTKKMKISGYSTASRNRGDTNNSPGDRRSRSAKYRPGGRRV